MSVDSTIIKVHQAAGSKEESIGKSRGCLTTKIHAVVDVLGNPLKVMLSGGQVHDSRHFTSGEFNKNLFCHKNFCFYL
ncbi:MAG: transposase [Selenomonadaceae bacterium]|nr:transposase [Selenomonadaceae bacterium]